MLGVWHFFGLFTLALGWRENSTYKSSDVYDYYGISPTVTNGRNCCDEEKKKTQISKEPCTFEGKLKKPVNWFGYLAEFDLAPHNGILQYRISYAKRDCCIKLLLYLHDDVDKMRAHMNCLQKLGVLDPRGDQVITLSPTEENSGCNSNETRRHGEDMIDCKSGRKLSSAQTLHWSIAVSSCGLPKGLDISYKIMIHGYVGTCPTKVSNASKTEHFTVSTMIWTVIFTLLMGLN